MLGLTEWKCPERQGLKAKLEPLHGHEFEALNALGSQKHSERIERHCIFFQPHKGRSRRSCRVRLTNPFDVSRTTAKEVGLQFRLSRWDAEAGVLAILRPQRY
jgi:hypothetical protein